MGYLYTDNLLKGANTSQSSDYVALVSNRAVDNDDSTCAETGLAINPQWNAYLEQNYTVHTVLAKTGHAFGCNILFYLCITYVVQ